MKVQRWTVGAAAIASTVGAIAIPLLVFATSTSYGGGSVQAYSATSPLDTGTIVQLADKDTSTVEIATQKNLSSMFGVTVDRGQLPVTISNGNHENETYVAVSGTYNVLVSTQGGAINQGDYITLSSVNGVGMKASTDQKTVFGRANGSFDGSHVTLGQATLKDTTGRDTQTVALGSVPVTINIQRNPNSKSTKVDVPSFLERVGQAIAEKEVNPIRIYLSAAITAITLIAAIVVIYAGVRNSVVSIGRNPMSKRSIFHALIQVILTGILILVIGLFAVYLLLKL